MRPDWFKKLIRYEDRLDEIQVETDELLVMYRPQTSNGNGVTQVYFLVKK